ncbi:FAR1-related sequence 5-like protein, partial [Tanacetum coccineum]
GLEKDEYNDVMAKVFDTLDDAYMFYNGYALLHGFGIRIHTTYKNKVTFEWLFKFPFSPFVGVNHHGQSILFGSALLENEKEETFEWLFKEFKNCMFDKHPDQDKAMGNAILKVKSDIVVKFESMWEVLCDKYNSETKSWISKMYKKLSHWAKAYFKDVFLVVIEARRAAEEDEDFKTMNSMPVLSSIHPIEAKAGASYTRKMFEAFKKEWVEATNNLT